MAGVFTYLGANATEETTAAILIACSGGFFGMWAIAVYVLMQKIIPNSAFAAGAGTINGIANTAGSTAPIIVGFVIGLTNSFSSGLLVIVIAPIIGSLPSSHLSVATRAVGPFIQRCAKAGNPMNKVPIIDLLGGRNLSSAALASIADQIGKAMEQVGSFVITNCGMPSGLIDRTREISRQFFELPETEKLKNRTRKKDGRRAIFRSARLRWRAPMRTARVRPI